MMQTALQNRKKTDYIVACVNEFARTKALPLKESYLYLQEFKGIQFLDEHYEIEHTLSFDDVIDDLSTVCRNNEGAIR
jgi:hypothetical protein